MHTIYDSHKMAMAGIYTMRLIYKTAIVHVMLSNASGIVTIHSMF